MSTAALQRLSWRSFRFGAAVLLIFLLQVTLIFWLSDRTPPVQRPAQMVPTIRLVGPEAGEILALENPALFALPNVNSFSGEAWMNSQPLEYRAFDWNEVPRWLPLSFQPLDVLLADISRNSPRTTENLSQWPAPEMNEPGMLRLQFLPVSSTLQVYSSDPDIMESVDLPLINWPHSDLLTNSIVQVVINSAGKAISTTLLTSSGLKLADDYALKQARELQYKRLPATEGPKPMWESARWAQLVFNWYTLPLPASTNLGGAM